MKAQEEYVLIIIESLRENDKKTGSLLNSELLKLKKIQNPSLKTIVFTICSKEELIGSLKSIIKIQKEKGMVPHLHFEIHGYENGLELNNGDCIDWSELMRYFVRINYLTKNYLVIYLSVCFGSSILRSISPLGRAPFVAIITPTEKINEWQIISGFTTYYDESVRKMNEEIGEEIWKVIPINYCFERITRFEPTSNFGKEMIDISKKKLIDLNPNFINNSKDEIYNEAKRLYKNNCDELKSNRDYFLMKDLKN